MRARFALPVSLLVAVALFAILPDTVRAQEEPPPRNVSAALGLFQFDIVGDGVTPMIALRGGMPIGAVLFLEGNLTAARPGQTFGTSTILIPEAQLQIHLPFGGSFVPYLGLGAGLALDLRPGGADNGTDLTISGGLGIRWWLTEQIGVVSEFRARGMGTDFGATSADYTIGLSYQL